MGRPIVVTVRPTSKAAPTDLSSGARDYLRSKQGLSGKEPSKGSRHRQVTFSSKELAVAVDPESLLIEGMSEAPDAPLLTAGGGGSSGGEGSPDQLARIEARKAAAAANTSGSESENQLELSEEAWIGMIEDLEAQLTYKRGQWQRLTLDANRPETTGSDLRRVEETMAHVKAEISELEADLDSLKVEFDADYGGGEGGELAVTPAYMKGRLELTGELEKELDDVPFEHFPLMSGQGQKRCQVGSVKAVVRATGAGEQWAPRDMALIDRLRAPPVEFYVRVYVLRGDNLMAMDATGASDPYLKVRLGGQTLDNRSEHLNDVTTAHFYRMFELNTQLPGESLLTLECWDYDGFGRRSDDLIGRTEIDLDDRIFSDHWQALHERPPLERRSLYTPLSSNPQGSLLMWVDILTPERAAASPPLDISPPPAQRFELRVVCWEAKDIPKSARDASELADLYTSIRFGRGKLRSTDTHFRAQNGAASWNWRFREEISIDSFTSPETLRLTVQLWERDLLSANDNIGETTIDLARWLKRIYARRAISSASRAKGPLYWSAKDEWDPRAGERPRTAEEESTSVFGFERLKQLATALVEQQPLLQVREFTPLLQEDDSLTTPLLLLLPTPLPLITSYSLTTYYFLLPYSRRTTPSSTAPSSGCRCARPSSARCRARSSSRCSWCPSRTSSGCQRATGVRSPTPTRRCPSRPGGCSSR